MLQPLNSVTLCSSCHEAAKTDKLAPKLSEGGTETYLNRETLLTTFPASHAFCFWPTMTFESPLPSLCSGHFLAKLNVWFSHHYLINDIDK